MSSRKTRLFLILALLAISFGLIGWATWPPAATQDRIFIKPGNMTVPGAPAPQPAVLETRVLSTLWPHSVRLGDVGRVRLGFTLDPLTREWPGAAQTPNVYDTHNVLLEARLELPGMDVNPPGLISQPLLPGQDVSFTWEVSSRAEGDFAGEVWLYLRFVPRAAGVEQQAPIAVKPVRVRAVSLWGLSAGAARAAGWGGVALGVILCLPFLDELLRRLLKPEVGRQRGAESRSVDKNMTKIMKIAYKG